MKTLTILSVVQTGILLILLGKIVLFEEESTVPGDVEQNALLNNPFDGASTDGHATAIFYPDEYQLRKRNSRLHPARCDIEGSIFARRKKTPPRRGFSLDGIEYSWPKAARQVINY